MPGRAASGTWYFPLITQLVKAGKGQFDKVPGSQNQELLWPLEPGHMPSCLPSHPPVQIPHTLQGMGVRTRDMLGDSSVWARGWWHVEQMLGLAILSVLSKQEGHFSGWNQLSLYGTSSKEGCHSCQFTRVSEPGNRLSWFLMSPASVSLLQSAKEQPQQQ